MKLLERVGELLAQEGYVIENIDATLIAQKPKLRPYIAQMEENIAQVLGIEKGQVNVKATTEEGIASQAICSLTGLYEGSFSVADSQARGCQDAGDSQNRGCQDAGDGQARGCLDVVDGQAGSCPGCGGCGRL